MRIELDNTRCEGHAMCEAVAPDIFSVEGAGPVTISRHEIHDGDRQQVEDAVQACPVSALKLTKS